MPTECPHGKIMDPGDFGAKIEHCPKCNGQCYLSPPGVSCCMTGCTGHCGICQPKHIGTLERVYDEENGARYVELDLPSDNQIGGDHYKNLKIQPVDFIEGNGLGWCEGNAIKYICRHKIKNGAQDIDKAIHYLQLLKERDYASERPSND